MTSDTIINGKTQTSLLYFFSGEAAVTQATLIEAPSPREKKASGQDR